MDYDYFAEQLRELQRSPESSSGERPTRDPDMPPLEPFIHPGARQTPSSTSASASTDVEMDDVEGRHEGPNNDSESDRDTLEVEMQAATGHEIDDPPLPEIEPVNPPPRSTNRRARVDDDEDYERDRRHPTERVTNPSSSQSTRPATPHHQTSATNAPSSTHSDSPSSAGAAPTLSGQTPAGRRPHPFVGIAFTFGPDGMQGPGQPGSGAGQPRGPGQEGPRMPGGLGAWLGDLLNNPTVLSEIFGMEPDIDDPERADRLLSGLEEVPAGLVRRLERVGGMAGSSGAELSGGDSGCAVCWEKLLEADDVKVEEDSSRSKQKAKEEELEQEALAEKTHPRIVSLPCAHVFHAECLRPWFSQPKQTTCPTCRFNIDPENLTFVPYRQRQRQPPAQAPAQPQSASTSAPATQPVEIPAPSATQRSQLGASQSADSTSEGDTTRGRTAPAAAEAPRRAGSEPPLNRIPRPGPHQNVLDSFTLPGGHVVIVSERIRFVANAQGELVEVAGHAPEGNNQHRQPAQDEPHRTPPQPAGSGQAGSVNPPAAPASASASPASEQRPFGPAPPPGTGRHGAMPNFGNLPEGMISFDMHFPVPASFFAGAAQAAHPGHPHPPPSIPTQANATPGQNAQPPLTQGHQGSQGPQRRPAGPFRFPGTFAGVNFGTRPPGSEVHAFNATDMLRRMFNAAQGNVQRPPASQPTAGHANTTAASAPAPPNAAGETQAPPEGTQNSTHETPTSAPATGGHAGTPAPGNDEQAQQPNNDADFLRFLVSSMNNPATLLSLLSAGLMNAPGLGFGLGRAPAPEPRGRVKKDWVLPPAPGPTLRQRVERREREAGFRCSDISCGLGPSDEEPFVSPADDAMKQLSIYSVDDASSPVCGHAFHSSCLVSAERVALRGADASILGNDVEVSCPVCRGVGCVSKSDWDEGVHTLQ